MSGYKYDYGNCQNFDGHYGDHITCRANINNKLLISGSCGSGGGIDCAGKVHRVCVQFTTLRTLEIDPLGRPTVTAGRDHCFCTCRPFVRPSFSPSSRPHFLKSSKQNKQKTMFATGETVGLAEWIIDETCLVIIILDIF